MSQLSHLKNDDRSIFSRSSPLQHLCVTQETRDRQIVWKPHKENGFLGQCYLPLSLRYKFHPACCVLWAKCFVLGDFQRITPKSQLESSLRPRNTHCTAAPKTAKQSAGFSKDSTLARPPDLSTSSPRPFTSWALGCSCGRSPHSFECSKAIFTRLMGHSRNLTPWRTHLPTNTLLFFNSLESTPTISPGENC